MTTVMAAITIRNETTDSTFEVPIIKESMTEFKLKIEQMQGIPFERMSLLYNGNPVNDDGTTE